VDDFVRTTKAVGGRKGAIFRNPAHKWEEIMAELLATVSAIQVRTINGLAGDVLDYETHKGDGLHVIAIGGDKLSRGLTLEGLSVSYFMRCSRMYDTLMQMGRWFGYRPGYLDLCRLYTTSELCEWFGHIAIATEELRNEFDLMVKSGGTPKDFGLRVRSHPKLMVTSQVKMRHGQTIQITFQGDIVETINFYRDQSVVGRNWNAAENLVSTLEAEAGTSTGPPRDGLKWTGVPAESIVSFLNQYKEHDSAVKVRTVLLAQYIEKEVGQKRLGSWTVLIAGGSKKVTNLAGVSVRLVERGWHQTAGTADWEAEKATLIGRNQYRIRRLVNPSDEKVDLDKSAIEAAMRATIEDWELDARGRDKPTDPAGRFLRQARDPDKGLLILYPLDPGEAKSENGDTPIIAFAISFPTVNGESASKVTYTVNNVYQREEEMDFV